MSRLGYHSTSVKSFREEYSRHPLDDKYRCGFDPRGEGLKKCVNHWQNCENKECRAKFKNWLELKKELLDAYGR